MLNCFSRPMSKKAVVFPAVLLWLLTACGPDNPTKTPSEPEYYFYLADTAELVFTAASSDTIYLRSNLPLSELWPECRQADPLHPTDTLYPIPVNITELRHVEDDLWQVILSDNVDVPVYHEDILLCWQNNSAQHLADIPDHRLCLQQKVSVRKAFFTHLPTLFIETPARRPILSKELWVQDTYMVLYDSRGCKTYQGKLSIKGRGNTSWAQPKKPYTLKLDEKTELLGMPTDNRWLLLANALDKTLLRNHLAYFLARAKGSAISWTPRGEYVELILNGVHKGNYYLCEKIEVGPDRLALEKNKKGDTTNLSFLVELDVYFDEINRFRTPIRNLPVMIHYPDDEDLTGAQMDYIEQYFTKLENFFYEETAKTIDEIRAYVDLESYIDYRLLNELTGNLESSHPKSVFMYSDKGGPLKTGPAWDYDYQTFGHFYRYGFLCMDCLWNWKIFATPEVRALACERWERLLPEFEKVFDEIDQKKSQLATSAAVNESLWEFNQEINEDEDLPFEQAVDLLKQNLQSRMDWITENISTIR